MGKISEPHLVKLFMGMISSENPLFHTVIRQLTDAYGPVDLESPVWPWERSDYYQKEMGTHLKRKFIFFERLIHPADISDIKLKTNELEQHFLNAEGGRRINLDPGYLDSAKLVLVSTKDYSHRIFLSDGIYGEVTLIYKNNAFQPLPFTYPDYGSDAYRELFHQARSLFRAHTGSGRKA